MRCWVKSVLFVVAAASVAWAADARTGLESLRAERPQVQTLHVDGQLQRLYGTELGYGDTPEQTADGFIVAHAEALGLSVTELTPGNQFDGSYTQPVMYEPETDSYKFTLVYYHQQRDGVPVYGADVRLLVKNTPGNPLVLVATNVRDLGTFSVGSTATRDVAIEAAEEAALAADPSLVRFSDSEIVIWAGRETERATPTLAVSFIADSGRPATPEYHKWLFVCDAGTGAVLYQENMILNAAVTGTVTAKMSPDYRADACVTETVQPMPYARIAAGSTVVYANAAGEYSIDLSAAATLTSEVRGRYFNVNNQQSGGDAVLTQAATPPAVVNFLHNNGNTEYTTAEVNAYLQANNVRDFALAANPSYPTIATQYDWPVNVNLNDTCNAYYDYSSLNFFIAGGGCNNTAFGDVVHHEYGHHLVNVGGSGQGAYGEGIGDSMGMLITGRSELGIGFESCSAGIRNADNTYQYPCSGEIHDCGQLLSGCVWDLRELLASDLGHVRDLTVNSILLHSGESITPSICTDFLALDDGEYPDQIIEAFGLHNMYAGPPPANDPCSGAIPICPGTYYSGNTGNGSNDGTATCGTSDSSPDLWYSYVPATSGTLTASLCTGTSYDSVLSIRTGCPGSGTELGCDDDGCGTGGGPSTVTVSVTAGTTYYIRVSGWQGAAGPFSLYLTGPACGSIPLEVTFPNGLPEVCPPGQPTSFDVRIEDRAEHYVSGSGTLHYRLNGGEFHTAPLSASGGNLYRATLPPMGCATTPEFYVSAQGDGGSTVTSPDNAPTGLYLAQVGTLTVVFNDNFQTNLGWTVQNGTGLTAGAWQRGTPVGGGTRGDPPTDYDGSGQCYLTGNTAGDSDIDGGYTRLISPVLDLSAGSADVSYAIWYTNNFGGDPNNDSAYVHVSNNNGTSWVLVRTYGPVTQSGWTTATFRVADFVTPTNQMRLRFEASDLNTGSVVEAGVDAVRVQRFECSMPYVTGDMNCDGVVDFDDIRPFVTALSGEAAYLARYPDCLWLNGDCNDDSNVTFDDIRCFVSLLGS